MATRFVGELGSGGARIWAITINTFREAVRDKILYGVLGLGCTVLLLTLALAELSLNQEQRVVLDVGLASISFFSVVIAVFLGSSLLYKEMERKTLYVILPKPIHRWQFLLGKYLGIVVTALVFISVMGGIQLFVAAIQGGADALLLVALPALALLLLGLALWRTADRTAAFLLWSLALLATASGVALAADAPAVPLLAALLLVFCEVCVISAFALLFSSFSTPFLTGALTLGVWMVGRSADEMAEMRTGSLSEPVVDLLHVLARVVPNLHLFYPGWGALSGATELEGGLSGYLLTTSLYGLAYATVLLIFAAVIFRRRDFL